MDIYDEIRAMYTVYIERVAGFARQEYLRTLRHHSRDISLDALKEDEFHSVTDRYFPNEFAFTEERLSQTIKDLSLIRRQILELLFVEQLTAPEIAERLGCSVNCVYKEKHHLLRKIKATMEDDSLGK